MKKKPINIKDAFRRLKRIADQPPALSGEKRNEEDPDQLYDFSGDPVKKRKKRAKKAPRIISCTLGNPHVWLEEGEPV